MSVFIHPAAIVEDQVELGDGTKVWDGAHIRRGARIGRDCIIGEKAYVAYDVEIGAFVKVNAAAYLCAGVHVEDFCMISAHVVFTNDRFPRAGNLALDGLQSSAVSERTMSTFVRRGATVGANSTIGPGVTLGAFCMVGMGSVVTRDVPPHRLVIGNPARAAGWVCSCGERVEPRQVWTICDRCGASVRLVGASLHVEQAPQSLTPSGGP